MPTHTTTLSQKQLVFREMVFGTLVYAVVLGFFADYTSILDTKSYSTTFLVAIVMQLLTYLTLLVKRRVVAWFGSSSGARSKAALIVGVWLVLFLSKFVFLAVIDVLFGENVQISGFLGLLAIILAMTIAKELIDYIFAKLAD